MNLKSTPRCVGIIMDGNRRFAKEKNLPVFEGHRQGWLKLREFLRWSKEAKINYVVAYAFSTENWNRKAEEVSYLMDLFRFILDKELESLHKEGIRVKCIGDLSRLPVDIQDLVKRAEAKSAKNKGITFVPAISYGGRQEIIDAVNKIIRTNGKHEIKEGDFASLLYTKDIPDPDLVIRTSGEMRTSGFLPWQAVYSELFFIKNYWPAFTKADFDEILEGFSKRQRRNGK